MGKTMVHCSFNGSSNAFGNITEVHIDQPRKEGK